MRYSASNNAFYPEEIEYPFLPDDLIDITPERMSELMQAQSEGKDIRPRGDSPAAYSQPEPSPELLLKIQQQKRQDAYRAEADPLYMEWQYDQTSEAEQAWRDKVSEIKLRYPLQVES